MCLIVLVEVEKNRFSLHREPGGRRSVAGWSADYWAKQARVLLNALHFSQTTPFLPVSIGFVAEPKLHLRTADIGDEHLKIAFIPRPCRLRVARDFDKQCPRCLPDCCAPHHLEATMFTTLVPLFPCLVVYQRPIPLTGRRLEWVIEPKLLWTEFAALTGTRGWQRRKCFLYWCGGAPDE